MGLSVPSSVFLALADFLRRPEPTGARERLRSVRLVSVAAGPGARPRGGPRAGVCAGEPAPSGLSRGSAFRRPARPPPSGQPQGSPSPALRPCPRLGSTPHGAVSRRALSSRLRARTRHAVQPSAVSRTDTGSCRARTLPSPQGSRVCVNHPAPAPDPLPALWTHTLGGLWWLLSFMGHNVFKAHPRGACFILHSSGLPSDI